MSHQTTYADLLKSISSQGLVFGHMPCAVLAGRTPAQYGQGLVHASLSARQAKEKGLLTSGTYGPPCIGWLGSAALSLSLASNLRALTQTTGSTLYKLTWKGWVMPSGRARFRLRASAHRISGTGLTGWPTPTASNTKNAYQDAEKVIARKLAGRQSNLQDFACLAGWPTPAARDHKGGVSGREDAQREIIHGHTGRGSPDSGCGPVNGFWGSADWLFCRDEKWRPVEPELIPLVDGDSARVGKIRAYGNAVNAEAATAFVKAYMMGASDV